MKQTYCLGCVRKTNCSRIWVSYYPDKCPFKCDVHDSEFRRWRFEYIGRLDIGDWDHSPERLEKAAEGRRRALREQGDG